MGRQFGAIDAAQLQYTFSRARDNLAGIPSLLTTRTQSHVVNVALPLAQLLRASQTSVWPLITTGWQTVWQAGDAIPANGGFRDASQVPDQRTDNVVAAATWQRGSGSLIVRYNRSSVDNRQPHQALRA